MEKKQALETSELQRSTRRRRRRRRRKRERRRKVKRRREGEKGQRKKHNPGFIALEVGGWSLLCAERESESCVCYYL